MKINNLGGYAMRKANKRRMQLNLPEVLTDDKGNVLKLTKDGRLVRQ